MAVVISAIGVASPLGHTPQEFVQAVSQKKSVLRPLDELMLLEHSLGARVDDLSLRGILKKRKEKKLFTRSAALGLLAAYRCIGKINDPNLGLFVAVGREPPDEGEAEECLIAAQQDGRFDEPALASKGRYLYPPLLPLRTLPNMILAHISIQLGIMGENGCWAGGERAAVQAFQEGYWAIREGRCLRALVGGADGFINLGSARDLHRQSIRAPSEGAIFFCLEHTEDPSTGMFLLEDNDFKEHREFSLEPFMGYCGAPQSLFELLYLLHCDEMISWGGLSFQKTLQ